MICGVPYCGRRDKFKDLVASIGPASPVDTVVIADNSPEHSASDVSSPHLDVITYDLDPYAGASVARNAIYEYATSMLDADRILYVDSDMSIPYNVGALDRVLDARPDLGAVGGVLLEGGSLRSSCYDLVDADDILIRGQRDAPTLEYVDGIPFARFDMIQQCMVVRTACLADYRWDESIIVEGEHLDLFLGQRDSTWSFGVTPAVAFPHDPGGPSEYVQHRYDPDRTARSKQYVLEKWGYRQVLNGQMQWLEVVDGQPTMEDFAKRLLTALPAGVQARFADLRDRYRHATGGVPT